MRCRDGRSLKVCTFFCLLLVQPQTLIVKMRLTTNAYIMMEDIITH